MWWSISGILVVLVGTSFSLWHILNRNTEVVGTWIGSEIESKEAPKEKRFVKIGIFIITVGSFLQIIGVIFP